MYTWLKGNFERVRMQADDSGTTTVLSVGDPADELRLLRQCAAVVPNYDWSPIAIEGADAGDYLHRRLSNTVRGLPEGSGVQALQLTGEGRVEFRILLYRLPGSFLGLVPTECREEAYESIQKYVLMDDVRAERTWESTGAIRVVGPRAEEAVRAAAEDAAAPDAPWGAVRARIAGTDVVLARDGRWPLPCIHVVGEYETLLPVVQKLHESCEALGGGLAGEDALEYLRVESGVARFGRDFSPGDVPLEADLVAAVDYDKGCFPGQEFLARIRNLGHPARLLARLSVPGEAELKPGFPVLDGDKAVGNVTSSATFPGAEETPVLAKLKWEARALTDARIRCVEEHRDARVIDVPGRDAYKDKPERPDL